MKVQSAPQYIAHKTITPQDVKPSGAPIILPAIASACGTGAINKQITPISVKVPTATLQKFSHFSSATILPYVLKELSQMKEELKSVQFDSSSTPWIQKNAKMLVKLAHSPLHKKHAKELDPLLSDICSEIMTRANHAFIKLTPTTIAQLLFTEAQLLREDIGVPVKAFMEMVERASAHAQAFSQRELADIIWALGEGYTINPKAKDLHSVFERFMAAFDNALIDDSCSFKLHQTSLVINGIKNYLVHNANSIPQAYVEYVQKQMNNLLGSSLQNCPQDAFFCIPNLLYSAAVLNIVNKEVTDKLVGFLEDVPLNQSALSMLYLLSKRFPEEISYPKWLSEEIEKGGMLSSGQDYYTVSKGQKALYQELRQHFSGKSEEQLKLEATITALSLDIFLNHKNMNWAIEYDGHPSHFNVFKQPTIATDFRDRVLLNLGYHPIHITPNDENPLKKIIGEIKRVTEEKRAEKRMEMAKQLEEELQEEVVQEEARAPKRSRRHRSPSPPCPPRIEQEAEPVEEKEAPVSPVPSPKRKKRKHKNKSAEQIPAPMVETGQSYAYVKGTVSAIAAAALSVAIASFAYKW